MCVFSYEDELFDIYMFFRINHPHSCSYQLQGLGNRYTHIFGTISPDNTTAFAVQMREQEWRVDPTLAAVSRGDFMRALVNIDTVLLTAQLTSEAHQSR